MSTGAEAKAEVAALAGAGVEGAAVGTEAGVENRDEKTGVVPKGRSASVSLGSVSAPLKKTWTRCLGSLVTLNWSN